MRITSTQDHFLSFWCILHTNHFLHHCGLKCAGVPLRNYLVTLTRPGLIHQIFTSFEISVILTNIYKYESHSPEYLIYSCYTHVMCLCLYRNGGSVDRDKKAVSSTVTAAIETYDNVPQQDATCTSSQNGFVSITTSKHIYVTYWFLAICIFCLFKKKMFTWQFLPSSFSSAL